MSAFICEHCGAETNHLIECKGEGIRCPACMPRAEKTQVFPAIITRGGRDNKFERYALRPDEIKRTQELRTTVRTTDSPERRAMDDIRKESVYIGAVGSGMSEFRNKKVISKFNAKFGEGNWKVVRDDGTRVDAVPIHASR